ncbi:MAG: CpaD family pilus assembly lipoprotein [Holosporaceae bacterium]|jgi:type IV pilus biogenesis protein CpaD/CtpE|nr:CpaD family pilus assembly lipoprotein [Holosporaceae bacterium]
MTKTKYLLIFFAVSLFLAGCKKQYLPNDGYIPEVIRIDAQEVKKSYFFGCSQRFNVNPNFWEAIDKFLEDVHREEDNIGFMLLSHQSIPVEIQEKVKNQLYALMYKHGFIGSRIINFGICIYKDAKTGIRIDVLKYDVKKPNCNQWVEYIGDTDTNKNLPKYGAAGTYNMIEMIANKADFAAPRKYKGAEAKTAITAIGSASGGSSGGGSGGVGS